MIKKTLVGLVALVLGAATWWIGLIIIEWLFSLDKKISGAIVASFIGLVSVLITQWSSKTRELSESHRPAKIEVYTTFFDIIEGFLTEERDSKDIPDIEDLSEDLKNNFMKLNRGLIVWASPNVIQAWLNYRKIASGTPTSKEIILSVDGILKEIRKDLGNSNFRLNAGDLVKIYLKDPNEIQ